MMKVCVTGCGVVGPTHMKALSQISEAELYAVCDIIPERAKGCAEEYGIKAYCDYDEMLLDKNIEAVHICTPHYLHLPMAVKALAAGKNVVLEKPVCITRKELEELDFAQKNASGKLCVMLQNRTNNSIEELKNIISTDKSIGKLLGINGVMHWHRDEAYYRSEPWRGKWCTEGGGAVINQAVHLLDLINFFGHVTNIRASISTKCLDGIIEVEDTADAYMTLKDGGCATFYAANTSAVNRPFELELCFENVVFRYSDNVLYRINGDDIKIAARDSGKLLGKSYWGAGHTRVIHDFYESLRLGSNNYISFNDAYSTAELTCALYESAKQNKTISIGEILI